MLVFCPLNGIFLRAKKKKKKRKFNLDAVKFMDFFLFMNCAFDAKSKNSDQIWILENFSYVYSNSFKVSHLSP